jgi:hypothetical protein
MGASVEALEPSGLHGEEHGVGAGDDAGPAMTHLVVGGVDHGERPRDPSAGRNSLESPAESGAKTISSPSLQVPPRLSNTETSATGAPPSTETFFSVLAAKKPIHVPSGEKKGFDAPSVPGRGPRVE